MSKDNRFVSVLVLVVLLTSGCSIRKYAVNKIGDALASGGSTYESDDDIQLVGDALPFGLKLIESLLAESPDHNGLLLAASQGFTTYSYVFVQRDADFIADEDLNQARQLRARARRPYMRANSYGFRGLETRHRRFREQLRVSPETAVEVLEKRDVPFIYWTAASLGSAISISRNDPRMIARLPEVDALANRALALDEAWEDGTLHELEVILAGTRPEGPDYDEIRRHYERALALSNGRHAGLYIAYAEAVSIPRQNSAEFRTLLEQALAINPDDFREIRLKNLIAQERAEWLLERIDDLILDFQEDIVEGETP